jgi:ArsR family transcriptional regulator
MAAINPQIRLKNLSLSFGSGMFKAMSDESRLRILNLMIENEMVCISDLELVLDFTQTKTSRHMGYLKNAGLVVSAKVDQWVFYKIKDEVYEIVRQVLSYLKKDQTLQKDQEAYEVMYSNRELAAFQFENRSWKGLMRGEQ